MYFFHAITIFAEKNKLKQYINHIWLLRGKTVGNTMTSSWGIT